MEMEMLLSEKVTKEITKILPEVRKDLQVELYKSIGYFPKQGFYSDAVVLDAFYNQASKFLYMTGLNEKEVEKFCSGDMPITSENRKTIYKITTLTLVQLAMI
jgi:hypothetical protein